MNGQVETSNYTTTHTSMYENAVDIRNLIPSGPGVYDDGKRPVYDGGYPSVEFP